MYKKDKIEEEDLTLTQCREKLGKKYADIFDEEIMELYEILKTIAELAIKNIYYDGDKVNNNS